MKKKNKIIVGTISTIGVAAILSVSLISCSNQNNQSESTQKQTDLQTSNIVQPRSKTFYIKV